MDEILTKMNCAFMTLNRIINRFCVLGNNMSLYCYTNTNFVTETKWSKDNGLKQLSDFDIKLQNSWTEKNDAGYFRYKLKIDKAQLLPGKFKFFAQVGEIFLFYKNIIVCLSVAPELPSDILNLVLDPLLKSMVILENMFTVWHHFSLSLLSYNWKLYI